VFWKILSIIDYHKPDCYLSKESRDHDETRTFKTITDNLEKRVFGTAVLNTAEITGIPQHRERIYIVCEIKTVFDEFSLDFPKIEKRKITEFLEPIVPQKYYYLISQPLGIFCGTAW
jgi:DNA (cytosine-5)-methyltransferase 1